MQSMAATDGTVRAVVHYAVAVEGVRGPRLACAPHVAVLEVERGRTSPHLRTDDPRAVTCRLCRDVEEWRRAFAEAPVIAGRDFFRGL